MKNSWIAVTKSSYAKTSMERDVYVHIENTIGELCGQNESTGIGVRLATALAEVMNASLSVLEDENCYKAVLRLPISEEPSMQI